MRRLLALLCIVVLSACSSDDTGKSDFNNLEEDVGLEDASGDAGQNNSNNTNNQNNINNGMDTGMDTGEVADMGPPPNPEGPLRIPCDDTTAEVYTSTSSGGANGSIIACATTDTATMQQVRNRTILIPDLTIESGYQSYLVAYRTTRATGEPGVSTMVFYLPDTEVAGASNHIVVANHGGVGIFNQCAPSRADHATSPNNGIVLPWVGRGYAVAAPDYAGLGTPGVHGVGNTLDLGHSALDAARAARALLDEGELSNRVVALGGAEGARASISMQSLAATYASDLDFAGAIGFASSFPQRSYAEFLRAGGIFPLVDGIGALRAYIAAVAYADYANLFGEARVAEVYNPDIRDFVTQTVSSECFIASAAALAQEDGDYTPPNTIGQLLDPQFRMDVVSCLNNQACSSDAQAFVDRSEATVILPDADGGEILFLSALDGANPSPNDQACLFEYLEQNGKEPVDCLWSGTNNVDLARQSMSYAVDWGIATLEGEATPDCPQNPMPSCQ